MVYKRGSHQWGTMATQTQCVKRGYTHTAHGSLSLSPPFPKASQKVQSMGAVTGTGFEIISGCSFLGIFEMIVLAILSNPAAPFPL